jgi:ribose 1,5-bisphosphokinase
MPNLPWGTLYLIIGNSGSGKDSLIQWVLKKWPSTKIAPLVPKRVITRPPSPTTEEYESVSESEFQKMSEEGAFSLQWRSYQIFYGVRTEINDTLATGRSILVNVSRQIVESTRSRFPHVCIIFIRVPFKITEARIRSRSREHDVELEARLQRARENQDFPTADYIIDNSGDLEAAGSQLLKFLLK